MKKKLLLWLLGAVGALASVYGCYNNTKEMSVGEVLYRRKCSSCHNLIGPGQFDREKWNLYVDKYGQKMTTEEKRTVLQHLVDPE